MVSGRRLTLAVTGGAAAVLAAAGGAAASDGAGPLSVPEAAVCDAASGTAAITVVHRAGTAAVPVVVSVRFASGLPGPRLGGYLFPAGTRPGTPHTFHVQWLPGGAYYLGDATDPKAAGTVTVPDVPCTLHAPDAGAAAPAVDAAMPDGPQPGPSGALAHTGAVPLAAPLTVAGGALALGAAGVVAARRARPRSR